MRPPGVGCISNSLQRPKRRVVSRCLSSQVFCCYFSSTCCCCKPQLSASHLLKQEAGHAQRYYAPLALLWTQDELGFTAVIAEQGKCLGLFLGVPKMPLVSAFQLMLSLPYPCLCCPCLALTQHLYSIFLGVQSILHVLSWCTSIITLWNWYCCLFCFWGDEGDEGSSLTATLGGSNLQPNFLAMMLQIRSSEPMIHLVQHLAHCQEACKRDRHEWERECVCVCHYQSVTIWTNFTQQLVSLTLPFAFRV